MIGPLMAYEVLTAFFLEAGFLGVMLFGMNKVGKGLHFAATLMVAVGTFISAFWILSVNSWMQTPAGFVLSPDGRFLPGDELAGDHLQPQLPLSPGPHRDRRLSDHRLRGRRGRRVAPAQAIAAMPMRARCSRWRCGWRRWSRRCRSSPATRTGSTRWSISRPRSWRWRAITKAIPTARRCILFGIPNEQAQAARLCGRHSQAVEPDPQA